MAIIPNEITILCSSDSNRSSPSSPTLRVDLCKHPDKLALLPNQTEFIMINLSLSPSLGPSLSLLICSFAFSFHTWRYGARSRTTKSKVKKRRRMNEWQIKKNIEFEPVIHTFFVGCWWSVVRRHFFALCNRQKKVEGAKDEKRTRTRARSNEVEEFFDTLNCITYKIALIII